MKKVAVVKKQLGRLGYKLDVYKKGKDKTIKMIFENVTTRDPKDELEVFLNWNGKTIIYSSTGFFNFKIVPDFKNLKSAIYEVEEEISKHKKDMLELRDKLKEEN